RATVTQWPSAPTASRTACAAQRCATAGSRTAGGHHLRYVDHGQIPYLRRYSTRDDTAARPCPTHGRPACDGGDSGRLPGYRRSVGGGLFLLACRAGG